MMYVNLVEDFCLSVCLAGWLALALSMYYQGKCFWVVQVWVRFIGVPFLTHVSWHRGFPSARWQLWQMLLVTSHLRGEDN